MSYLLVRIHKYADDDAWRGFLQQLRNNSSPELENKNLARNIWQLSLPDDLTLLEALLTIASANGLQYQAAVLQEQIVWGELSPKKDQSCAI